MDYMFLQYNVIYTYFSKFIFATSIFYNMENITTIYQIQLIKYIKYLINI